MVQSVLKLKEFCFSNVILFIYQCITATWTILLLLLDINLSCTNVFINTCILLLSISIKILKNNRLFFTNFIALLCVLSTPWCVFMYRTERYFSGHNLVPHMAWVCPFFGKCCPLASVLTFVFPSLFGFNANLQRLDGSTDFEEAMRPLSWTGTLSFPTSSNVKLILPYPCPVFWTRNVPAVCLASRNKSEPQNLPEALQTKTFLFQIKWQEPIIKLHSVLHILCMFIPRINMLNIRKSAKKNTCHEKAFCFIFYSTSFQPCWLFMPAMNSQLSPSHKRNVASKDLDVMLVRLDKLTKSH